MAASLTPVLGAAASAVRPLLTGPVVDGTVLGAFSRAVVIGVDTGSGPRVVSLLARGSVAVPNGVRLFGAEADLSKLLRFGEPAAIGAGGVRVGGLDVRVVRSWSSRVMAIDPDLTSVAVLAKAAACAQRGVPLHAVNRLAVALTGLTGFDPHLDGAVSGLVGLGRGLTPGGDDVLAGLLTGLHAAGWADSAAMISARALHAVTERTTLLSADLLRLAAAGEACLEVLAVLRAIHRPPRSNSGPRPGGAPVMEPINRLLSIGHTSGADLATGLAIGLRHGPHGMADTPSCWDLGSDREAATTSARQGAP